MMSPKKDNSKSFLVFLEVSNLLVLICLKFKNEIILRHSNHYFVPKAWHDLKSRFILNLLVYKNK